MLQLKIGSIMYSLAVLSIKVPILIQVLRITHALIWLNVLFYAACTFVEIWSCRPFTKAWKPWEPGSCVNLPAVEMASGVFNVVTDLTMLVLVQRVIWALKVRRRNRACLGGIFCIGIMASVFALLRLWYNYLEIHSHDYSYYAGIMGLFTYLERCCGFLILCLPVLPKFIGSFKRGQAPSTSNLSYRNRTGEKKEKKYVKWGFGVTSFETRGSRTAKEDGEFQLEVRDGGSVV
ncbi:hypothetical protein K469DRAFT_771728, partial [Zopfia rhizophila CBS 207.26]